MVCGPSVQSKSSYSQIFFKSHRLYDQNNYLAMTTVRSHLWYITHFVQSTKSHKDSQHTSTPTDKNTKTQNALRSMQQQHSPCHKLSMNSASEHSLIVTWLSCSVLCSNDSHVLLCWVRCVLIYVTLGANLSSRANYTIIRARDSVNSMW